MEEVPSTSVPGGSSTKARFQRRITDEPGIFRRTITGRWMLKMATYKPEIEGPAVEQCTCSTCVPRYVETVFRDGLK